MKRRYEIAAEGGFGDQRIPERTKDHQRVRMNGGCGNDRIAYQLQYIKIEQGLGSDPSRSLLLCPKPKIKIVDRWIAKKKEVFQVFVAAEDARDQHKQSKSRN